MTRQTENAKQARLDAAVVDAYERQLAASTVGSAGDGASVANLGTANAPAADFSSADLPAAELNGYLALHRRVAALELPDVHPSVRAAVLSAAAESVQTHGERSPLWPLKRALGWLFRPGPLLAVATAVAVLIAVSVRHETPPTVAAAADPSLALLEAPSPAAAPAPPAPVGATVPVAVPPAASPPPAAAVAAPAPAQAIAEVGDESARADAAMQARAPTVMARPLRTIAAQPASLGPAPAAGPATALDKSAESLKQNVAAQRPVAESDESSERNVVLQRGTGGQTGSASVANQSAAEAERRQPMANTAGERAEGAVANQRATAKSDAAVNRYAQAPSAAAEASGGAPAAAATDRAQAPAQREANREVAVRSDDAKPEDVPATHAKAGNFNATATVAWWKKAVAEARNSEDRLAALLRLAAIAKEAGDENTQKWAAAEIKAVQSEMAARKRADELQQSPPAQRAKAAPREPAELKPSKGKN